MALISIPGYAVIINDNDAMTYSLTFEDGVIGEKVTEFDDAQGNTLYQNVEVHTGNQGAQCTMVAGTTGFGGWGGILYFDKNMSEGDEIYIKANVFFPIGFDFSTDYALKFLRLRIRDSALNHKGYIDTYIRNDKSLMVQNEISTTKRFKISNTTIENPPFVLGETLTGETNGATSSIRAFRADNNDPVINDDQVGTYSRWEWIQGDVSGARVQLINPDPNPSSNGTHDIDTQILATNTWETIYYHVKFSAVAPLIEIYRNISGTATLVYADETDYTLNDATDICNQFNLFTYWNGEPTLPTTDQTMYIDDFLITETKPQELP